MPVKAKGKFRVTILGVSANETSRILFPVERDGWSYLLSTYEQADLCIFYWCVYALS